MGHALTHRPLFPALLELGRSTVEAKLQHGVDKCEALFVSMWTGKLFRVTSVFV